MKVLFIGNSHTYFNDMPALFGCLGQQLSGEKVEVTMLAYSGRTLKWHREEYFSIRFALVYGGYDYCVIQQYAHPFPDLKETEESMKQIVDLVKQCGVKPVIYMTWAARDQKEMRQVMSDTYRRLAKENDCMVAPVGEAFAKVQDECPDIDLYFRDGEHASPYGDYLIAYLMAVLLTGSREKNADSTGIDFAVRFNPESKLANAETDQDKLWIKLDEEKTARIREKVLEI